MTLCSVCGTILKSARGPDSHGLCLYHYFDSLVRGGLASEWEKRIYARMDKGWRGRADRFRLAQLRASENEAKLGAWIASRAGSENWKVYAFGWLVYERNLYKRKVEGIEALNFFDANSYKETADVEM